MQNNIDSTTESCIFCQIAKGKLPSKTIYEDKNTLAILDVNPINKGHVLLFPKSHKVVFQALSNEEIMDIAPTIKKISESILKGLKADGTSILISSGTIAGQKSSHAIIHIIPRFKDDGQSITFEAVEFEDFDKIYGMIR